MKTSDLVVEQGVCSARRELVGDQISPRQATRSRHCVVILRIRRLNKESTLRAVVGGPASATGTEFYRLLAQNLAHALDTFGAWVTEYDEANGRLRALAFWFGGEFIENYEYQVADTACETAIQEARLVHFAQIPENRYRGNPEPFRSAGVVSYLGAPLLSPEGKGIGHLAVVDKRPMPDEHGLVSLFEIFANRAVAEMMSPCARTERSCASDPPWSCSKGTTAARRRTAATTFPPTDDSC